MTESKPPRRVSTRGASGAVPTSGSQPPRSGQAPVRRSTRAQQPASGWAPTGAQATTASAAPKSGGGKGGSGGGKGGSGGGTGGAKATRTPEGPRWKRILKRVGVGALIAGFVAVAVGSIALMVIYSRLEVPAAADVALAQASTVYYADGETEMGRVGEANREIVSLDSMPDYVPHAVVAAEDRSFYTNPGIDFLGTARALFKTVVLGQKQGGSTITQQYVERYYVGETTTDVRGKIKEALLALKVDSEQTKDEVLENYMNTIYFGRGAYGIEAASKAYFGKSASQLTLSESAMLAGIIPAPSAWDPRVSPDRAEQRWNYVLDGMVEGEFITQEERDAQVFPETIEVVASDTFGGPTGYLLRTALDEAMADLGIDQDQLEMGGYRIVTTIDKGYQDATEQAVADMPDDHADNLHVAATTLDAETGAIRSMYGGADYLKVQRNAVTQDIAQAGSTFKPFAMIAALSNGYGLGTTYLANSGMEIEGFDRPVRNFAGVNYGRIDMVKATRNSVNTYYVQLGRDVGPEKVMQTAITAGLPEDTVGLAANAANVLGTASPTALQMGHAYTTIASGGLEKDPFIVQTITEADGSTVFEHEVDAQRVFDEAVIADTTYAMQRVVSNGTARKAAALGRPLAGKTGTSNDNRSAWFIGFSPQIVGVVSMYQVGPNGEVEEITPFGGYSQITGGSVPVDIWIEMMTPILDTLDVVDFPPRADVGEARNVITTPTPSPTPTPSKTAEPTPTPEPTDTGGPGPSVTPSPAPSNNGNGNAAAPGLGGQPGAGAVAPADALTG